MFHVISFQGKINRVVISSVFSFCFLASLTIAVTGQTIVNYSQWRNFSSVSKILYVSGMVDGLIYTYKSDKENSELASSIHSCLNELNITRPEIVAMVDNFYLNTQNWAFAPQDAIQLQLIDGHCYQYAYSKN